jgi:hypothetical protein
MRKLGITLQSLGMIGALGVVLTGCPVWSSEDFDDRPPTVRDGGVVTDGGGGGRCTTDGQCAGGFCDRASGTCTPSTRCSATTDCPAGQYCDSRRRLRPRLHQQRRVRHASPRASSATPRRARCVPGGRCTTRRPVRLDARPRPVCLGGSCQARTNQCQFDYQCTGQGQSCVDGRCVVGCTSAAQCAAGQQCTAGRCAYPTTGSCATPCATGSSA